MSPGCIGFVYRYAQEYLVTLPKLQQGSQTCKPLELLSLKAARHTFEEMQKAMQPLTCNCSPPDPSDTADFLEKLTNGDVSAPELIEQIPMVFKELDDAEGLFAKLQHRDEQKRAMASMLSMVFLMRNSYDDFVRPQHSSRRLSQENWAKWQSFIQWANISNEQLHAVLVFLAVRGAGKVKSLAKALPPDAQCPEDVVSYLMGNVSGILPSASHLSSDMIDLIKAALLNMKRFNLVSSSKAKARQQMYELCKMQAASKDNETLLKFSLVCQIGSMCGILGTKSQEGSAFMDEQNSTNILAAISFLRQIGSASSHAVYWGYILSRARALGFPTEEPHQIAIGRLACLCRSTSKERGLLQEAWACLSTGARQTLTDNLLADGIQEVAFVFTFLPMYLANARSNPALGLRRALYGLVDLMEVLRVEGCVEAADSNLIVVDLQQFAAFAKDVVNPGFSKRLQATAAHIKLVQRASDVQVLIATKHKERMTLGTWAEDQSFDMPGVLRKMERQIDHLESNLACAASQMFSVEPDLEDIRHI
eukprot:CAMPEP_0115169332 /NCGR_PEP_ID=MMETSP0270-20121206/1215_1 /TAXON_ID=71861 /ORGANISM="Scrippsiella trochoidea, Strain CCMP3099" /LENGTH=535 /DNA_ID=CAMNT_0002582029 /DNA_START=16 /DNA_END=1625 /DNA_ORIENTATION=-